MNHFKKLLILSFVFFSDAFAAESIISHKNISIVVNVFKAADYKGSFVNYQVSRSTFENLRSVLESVVIIGACFFDLYESTDYLIWNGKKIFSNDIDQSFVMTGRLLESNRLDVILTSAQKTWKNEEPPFEDICRQNIDS